MNELRKIIHIDMDAFYASVEQRDNPELIGKPVAVGGSRERGVVAAASYEARKFGVRSAMASVTAYKKCPSIIFVRPRFEVYKEVSNQIHNVFEEVTDLIEPLSLDEAYLDVTENKLDMSYAMDIATLIKQRIKETTGLTASAGISYNKFLAKIASDYNKPDGHYVITPSMAEKFIEQLKIEKFFGVGKVTAKRMYEKGIFTGLDLKRKSQEELTRWFGKAGKYYFNVSRGIDNREVLADRIRKSLGAERTFTDDVTTIADFKLELQKVVKVLLQRLVKANLYGRTLTLKAKYSNFKQVTRSKTIDEKMNEKDIQHWSNQLINDVPEIDNGIRLIGLQVSNFDHDTVDRFMGQLSFDF